MALAASAPLSKIYSSISADTVFKTGADFFKDRLADLPGNSTKLFGFETLLGMGVRNPDIALCFSKEKFDVLADWCNSCSPDPGLETYWSRIRDMVKGNGNSLREYLNLVWIELDRLGIKTTSIQEPGFFVELLKDKVDPELICRQVIPILTGNMNHPSCTLVEPCLSVLPDTGRLVHLGYFPARSVEKLRMTISFDHYHDIAPYCSKIFGKGLNRDILTRIEEFSELSDYGVLHLDIGEEIETRLGIEIRFQGNEQNPEYQWRWRDVFSILMDHGLCSSGEAQSILDFSGVSRFIDDSTFSPSWYKYFLYYIKGVFDFSGKEHYKAYCAFQRLSSYEDSVVT